MHKLFQLWEYFRRIVFLFKGVRGTGILSVFTEPDNKIKAHMNNDTETIRVERKLVDYFSDSMVRPSIVMCIGTDRSTGDSLGPMIGTKLVKFGLPKLTVLGTLEEPVHATNLSDNLKLVENQYHNPFILAIDASLGRIDSIGCITLGNGPLKPGAGVNKELPPVGEAHMTGIVNVGGFMEYMVLQNTRLNIIWNMSDRISQIIAKAYLQSLNLH